MKKIIYLMTACLLLSFNVKGNNDEVFIKLNIPKEYKSKEKFDVSKLNRYIIKTKTFDSKNIKGTVTVISDLKGKIISITVPENFPKKFYIESFFKIQNNSSSAFPCSVCWDAPYGTGWLCWLACDGSTEPTDPIGQN